MQTIALRLVGAIGLGFVASAVFADPGMMGGGMGPNMMHGMGPGMMHGMGPVGDQGPMAGPLAMLTKQDAGSPADMGLVHDLLMNHTSIKRTVSNLPDGIKTVTESNDPQVARFIKAHVASMTERLKDGREFNIFSATLPVLFDNREKITSKVEVTDKGSIVTQASTDASVVSALQAHAVEVSELAREGPVAMRRGMMARMARGPRDSRTAFGPDFGHGPMNQTQQVEPHTAD
jgi:hypothetical protein